MSRPRPKYRFKPDESSFYVLVFEVSLDEGKPEQAKLEINLRTNQVKFEGINDSIGTKYIPFEVYNLEHSEIKNKILNEYSDFSGGMFTYYTAGMIKKIFRYSEEFSYKGFIRWLEGGMLAMKHTESSLK